MRSLIVFALMGIGNAAWSAHPYLGPSGSNVAGDALDYTGAGIRIGQVENGRPGDPNWDTNSTFYASEVDPFRVLDGTFGSVVNDGKDEFGHSSDHATAVAAIMIGEGDWCGVAPDAELWSVATGESDELQVVQGLNYLATVQSKSIRVINMSYEILFDDFLNDEGMSHHTLYMDWAARRHEVLFVAAWGNSPGAGYPGRTPADTFNGIVVGASNQPVDEDQWRQSGWINSEDGFLQDDDALEIDILAPGNHVPVRLRGPGRSETTHGTSYSAPQVTGTAALMCEYVATQNALGNPRFSGGAEPNGMRHLVLKSALMNSADKYEGVQGAKHTALSYDGLDWDHELNGQSLFKPLSPTMGAGLLNAERAIEQISPGEYGPGLVPKMGWDYGSIGAFQTVDYIIDGDVGVGDYLSITVTWDRMVQTPNDTTYNYGDQFLGIAVPNIDLWVLPIDQEDFGWIIDASIATDGSVEHIFHKVGEGFGGPMKIRLSRPCCEEGPTVANVPYGLSWWIGSGSSTGPAGDYNKNGSVGPEDYDVWKSNFGTAFADADGNGNGTVDAADYTIWRDNLGTGSGSLAAVPEPSSAMFLAVAGALLGRRKRGRPVSNDSAAT